MIQTATALTCYHCGEPTYDPAWSGDKAFCCTGCKSVYDILSKNDLCEYYSLERTPGISFQHLTSESYLYLDEPSVRKNILEFDSPTFARLSFSVPSIHCISCIWLLENLKALQAGVLSSEVNFSGKTVRIDFNPVSVSPGQIAQRLASLGYLPAINLASRQKTNPRESVRPLLLKLAIAGFAFGNIMLLSFPEYLGLSDADGTLRSWFSYLNILLALPVILFSSRDYFVNAFKSFTQRQINIDVPIAAGLMALFSRSVFDILTHTGPGYLDSFSGLVFFLLIGRWFQSKTYESLAFDRDYKAYFPLAVQKRVNEDWVPVVVHDLRIGDRIRIRNNEIVAADSTLLSSAATLDYSFVTGESSPVKVNAGDLIFAGGRVQGGAIDLVVTRESSQSHLTSLWNNPAFQKQEEQSFRKTIDGAARSFTWIVLLLAFCTAVGWYFYDPSKMWLVLTSVLMVACPCALALAAPFTYGTQLRVFGRNHLYLKNADVIERMASVDAIVFDKTGTLTYTKQRAIEFDGELSVAEERCIKSLASYSVHPLSKLIAGMITTATSARVYDFSEFPGQGIEGSVEGHFIKLGSAEFVGARHDVARKVTRVYVSIDGEILGYFAIAIAVREGLKGMINRLGSKCIALLSGDNDADAAYMKALFGPSVRLLFNQSPEEKLRYVRMLQEQGSKVMMVGDGLNDAGALKQSDVGIAVTDETGLFTPACDGILQGDRITDLDKFLALARSSAVILKMGFAISFLYNTIALSFAVTGHLTPLIAAILMPVSSISVVGFSSLAVRIASKTKLKTTKSL